MRRRLLILFPSTERGGAEEYCLTLARGAIAAEWEVHAAFSARSALAELAREFEAAGARYHPLEVSDVDTDKAELFTRSMAHIWPVSRLLLEIQPHAAALVLCGIEYGLGSQIALQLSRVPTAVVFQLVPPGRRLRENLRRIRSALAHAQQYVTVSDQNRTVLADSLGLASKGEIAVIPNGVDIGRFHGLGRERAHAAVLRDCGLPEDACVIVTVGRLDHQKGYDLLVQAARGVVASFPSARFLWVGQGPDRAALEAQVAAAGLSGHVTFLGYRRDVPALLAGADLFVLPTRFEGQPFSVLEAMAAGTPIVVSRVSGIVEIMTDRVHGLLSPPDDPVGLESAIIEAIENPAASRERANSAREQAVRYGATRMCADMLSLLESAAAPDEIPEFDELLRDIVDSIRDETKSTAFVRDPHETAEPVRLGIAALITNYYPMEHIGHVAATLNAACNFTLQRVPADEAAWKVLTGLAFCHAHPGALSILRDWRRFEYQNRVVIDAAMEHGADSGRDHVERLTHSHPRRALRHYARRALLRDRKGIDWMREAFRLAVLRIRNMRGMRRYFATR